MQHTRHTSNVTFFIFIIILMLTTKVVGDTSSTIMTTFTTITTSAALCSDPAAQLLANHLTYYYDNQSLVTSFPVPVGTSISVMCALGYSPAGTSQEMDCGSSGSWTFPTCTCKYNIRAPNITFT